MSGDRFRTFKPDLRKLPQHLREAQTKPVPMRPGEVYGRVSIFHRGPGLIHPTARVYVTTYVPETGISKATSHTSGQIDLMDFAGRNPLATILLQKNETLSALTGLMRAYLTQGGDKESLTALVSNLDTSAVQFNGIVYSEEAPSND